MRYLLDVEGRGIATSQNALALINSPIPHQNTSLFLPCHLLKF